MKLMSMRKLYGSLVAILLLATMTAQASLSVSYQFVGKGNWSLDGVGSTGNNPVGTIDAMVPPGSTVVKAFLYSSLYSAVTVPSVVLDGVTIETNAFTALGVNPSYGLQAFRADVTAQVAAKVGSGSTNLFSFTVDSESSSSIDGEVLAIVYSNPAEKTRTIAFMDGFSASAGDSTQFNFASPLSMGVGFEALMSLGIGFSAQSSGQYSQVDINGRRLTTSAGGQDDGSLANGALITVGGIGDDLANPADPYALPGGEVPTRTDDELYNLAEGNGTNAAPFLSNGLTSFTVDTLNPSGDDNIFFLGVNVTAVGSVGPTDCSVTNLLTQASSLTGVNKKLLKLLTKDLQRLQKALTTGNPFLAQLYAQRCEQRLRQLSLVYGADTTTIATMINCLEQLGSIKI